MAKIPVKTTAIAVVSFVVVYWLAPLLPVAAFIAVLTWLSDKLDDLESGEKPKLPED